MGDVVRVNVNGHIPCDMVLLSSEDPNGLCQIMTANLDGESNLKVRMSLKYELLTEFRRRVTN